MRRLASTLFVALVIQIVSAAPAHAWWEKIDPFSGPGPFIGLSVEVQIKCFTKSADKLVDASGNPTTDDRGNPYDDDLHRMNFTGFDLSLCHVEQSKVRRVSI